MIAPNVSRTGKFSIGRHTPAAPCRPTSYHATSWINERRPWRQHRTVPSAYAAAGAIDERPTTREQGVQQPTVKRLDQSVPLQSP